ncbi:hypothetical protein LX36DRAFT_429848 [Colletotrichum falcatum]|nr:hypothetical protein LX36DRAFT_429848 [Colletotrichum falcatum]
MVLQMRQLGHWPLGLGGDIGQLEQESGRCRRAIVRHTGPGQILTPSPSVNDRPESCGCADALHESAVLTTRENIRPTALRELEDKDGRCVSDGCSPQTAAPWYPGTSNFPIQQIVLNGYSRIKRMLPRKYSNVSQPPPAIDSHTNTHLVQPPRLLCRSFIQKRKEEKKQAARARPVGRACDVSASVTASAISGCQLCHHMQQVGGLERIHL